jgi:hypothetical protein
VDSETIARKIKPIDEEIRTTLRIEPSAVTVPPDPSREIPREPKDEPELPMELQPVAPLQETAPSGSDFNFPATDGKPEPAQPVIVDSQYSESMPPAPQKLWDGISSNLGKKAVLGIIVVIIIVIILGAFFLYPMISNSDSVTPDNGTALTTVPKNINSSGMAVIPTKTQKPTENATLSYSEII